MMTKRLLILGLVAGALFGASQSLRAVTATGNVPASATIGATAVLTVSSTTLSFPNQDPDTTPSIPASEGAISVTAKARTGTSSTVSLTVIAADDLLSGGNTIPISNVTWTSSGAGFVAGTLNKTTAQAIGSWSGSGSRAGTQSFVFANSWTYATGNYSTTATYTLTAP